MKPALRLSVSALFILLVASPAAPLHAADARMSFFVTSVGSGKGADLGGQAGADKHCQALAESVGAGGRTWHAYLSTTGAQPFGTSSRRGNPCRRRFFADAKARSARDRQAAVSSLARLAQARCLYTQYYLGVSAQPRGRCWRRRHPGR